MTGEDLARAHLGELATDGLSGMKPCPIVGYVQPSVGSPNGYVLVEDPRGYTPSGVGFVFLVGHRVPVSLIYPNHLVLCAAQVAPSGAPQPAGQPTAAPGLTAEAFAKQYAGQLVTDTSHRGGTHRVVGYLKPGRLTSAGAVLIEVPGPRGWDPTSAVNASDVHLVVTAAPALVVARHVRYLALYNQTVQAAPANPLPPGQTANSNAQLYALSHALAVVEVEVNSWGRAGPGAPWTLTGGVIRKGVVAGWTTKGVGGGHKIVVAVPGGGLNLKQVVGPRGGQFVPGFNTDPLVHPTYVTVADPAKLTLVPPSSTPQPTTAPVGAVGAAAGAAPSMPTKIAARAVAHGVGPRHHATYAVTAGNAVGVSVAVTLGVTAAQGSMVEIAITPDVSGGDPQYFEVYRDGKLRVTIQAAGRSTVTTRDFSFSGVPVVSQLARMVVGAPPPSNMSRLQLADAAAAEAQAKAREPAPKKALDHYPHACRAGHKAYVSINGQRVDCSQGATCRFHSPH